MRRRDTRSRQTRNLRRLRRRAPRRRRAHEAARFLAELVRLVKEEGRRSEERTRSIGHPEIRTRGTCREVAESAACQRGNLAASGESAPYPSSESESDSESDRDSESESESDSESGESAGAADSESGAESADWTSPPQRWLFPSLVFLLRTVIRVANGRDVCSARNRQMDAQDARSILSRIRSGAVREAAISSELSAVLPRGIPRTNLLPTDVDGHRVAQRAKQIDMGKNTIGYDAFRVSVPRFLRSGRDPGTPDATRASSKRSWALLTRRWRRELHSVDPLAIDAAALRVGMNSVSGGGPRGTGGGGGVSVSVGGGIGGGGGGGGDSGGEDNDDDAQDGAAVVRLADGSVSARVFTFSKTPSSGSLGAFGGTSSGGAPFVLAMCYAGADSSRVGDVRSRARADWAVVAAARDSGETWEEDGIRRRSGACGGAQKRARTAAENFLKEDLSVASLAPGPGGFAAVLNTAVSAAAQSSGAAAQHAAGRSGSGARSHGGGSSFGGGGARGGSSGGGGFAGGVRGGGGGAAPSPQTASATVGLVFGGSAGSTQWDEAAARTDEVLFSRWEKATADAPLGRGAPRNSIGLTAAQASALEAWAARLRGTLPKTKCTI